MATAHAHPLSIIEPHVGAVASTHRLATLVAAIAAWTRHLLCGLHGHAMMTAFKPGHVFLRCAYCGAESAGWRFEISPALHRRVQPPRARAAGSGVRVVAFPDQGVHHARR